MYERAGTPHKTVPLVGSSEQLVLEPHDVDECLHVVKVVEVHPTPADLID